MSRTTKECRGITYRDKGNRWYSNIKKKLSEKKFFGYVDNGIRNGWPHEMRSPDVMKDLMRMRDADEDLKEYQN